MEVKQFGIDIVNIAPGDFATNIAAGRYHAPLVKGSDYEKSYGAQWGDPHRLFVNGEPSKSEDIYAIGNLIYFYLTGKHPFSSNNPLQSLYMMRKSKPQLTYTIFDDIIGRCLSKNPRDRYSDINELIKEIKEA